MNRLEIINHVLNNIDEDYLYYIYQEYCCTVHASTDELIYKMEDIDSVLSEWSPYEILRTTSETFFNLHHYYFCIDSEDNTLYSFDTLCENINIDNLIMWIDRTKRDFNIEELRELFENNVDYQISKINKYEQGGVNGR